MIPYGYPRISYLLHYQNDKNHQKKIKDALNVDEQSQYYCMHQHGMRQKIQLN